MGDTLQFPGWQVKVSRVILATDTNSATGVFSLDSYSFVAATIYIRDDVVTDLLASHFTVDVERFQWENYARRGNDLQYYAWELRHKAYKMKTEDGLTEYYRWHSRIRPVAGDIVSITPLYSNGEILVAKAES